MDLSNKVAFVTGVSGNIGKAIVETLAGCGANVGMMDGNLDELIKLEADINAKPGGKVFAIQGDVSRTDDLKNGIWQTVEVFGALHLAILL